MQQIARERLPSVLGRQAAVRAAELGHGAGYHRLPGASTLPILVAGKARRTRSMPSMSPVARRSSRAVRPRRCPKMGQAMREERRLATRLAMPAPVVGRLRLTDDRPAQPALRHLQPQTAWLPRLYDSIHRAYLTGTVRRL